MKRETFFEKFDLLAEAPGGVAKLRELILQWAVRGKLVPPDPRPTPAAESFPGFASVAVNAGDDGWPPHWLRVPLGKAGEWRGGGTPSKANAAFWDGEVPWVSPKDMKSLRISDAQDHISEAAVAASSVTGIPAGSILMVVRGMILARAFPVALTTRAVTINQDMKALTPREKGAGEFLLLALRAFEAEILGAIERSSHGTCKLSTSFLNAFTIPIPPLGEMKRIVAKVDELVEQCDRLEAQQQERETRRATLAQAALARFADAPTPANLNFLFYDSYAIEPADLRKSILTLAVQGNLVPHDLTDESGQHLLDRIARSRGELLRRGYPNREEACAQTRKQDGQLLPGGLRPLPTGWAWATLMQASLLVVDCHNKTAPYVDKGVRLLRTTNVRDGHLNLSQPKFVTEATYERWSARCKPEPGDLVITREAPMGEVCIIPEGMKVCLGQRMMLIRLAPETMDPMFVLYSLMDPDLMTRVQDKPVGATVQHLRVGGVETLLMAVPPLAEQRRIVARVEQFMVLVDRLEAQVATSRDAAEELTRAIVAELTAER